MVDILFHSTSLPCSSVPEKKWKHFALQLPTSGKKNHEQLRMFHRATKKGGRNSSYTTQVMEKENCKIYARVNRLSRTKRSYQKKEPDLDDSPGSLNMYSHQNQEEG